MIVHIGFHKTGTTFLQKYVFPYIKEINFIDRLESEYLLNDLIFKNSFSYDINKVETLVSDKISSSSLNLFSYESLVGPIYIYSAINRKLIADRLKDLGFKKVIISIRNQEKLIESIYREYIHHGGVVKPKHFLEKKYHIFDLDYCKYFKVISYYKELFGEDNVLIILSEELKTNQQDVLEKIKTFIGIETPIVPYVDTNDYDANRSISNLAIRTLRIINHFTYNSLRPSNLISNRITTWKVRYIIQKYFDRFIFSRLSGKKDFINDNQKNLIRNYFRENNRKLDEKYRLNLGKYKYPL